LVKEAKKYESKVVVNKEAMFLLHRPDALMEPEEIAEAFDILEVSGKVRNFGVFNMKPIQMELLKKCVHQPLEVNQLQLSIMNAF